MSIGTSALTRPRRGRLYIVIGAVLAVLAFATAAGIASMPLIQGTTTGIRVVVASHDIQARTVIQSSDLTLASISPTPPQSFTAINKVTGMGARVDIPAGMPISSNLVAPSGDLVSSSDVAYLPIPRGWVAVTVPTSEQVGVGGYVQVGDRITILATINTQSFGQSPGRAVVLKRTLCSRHETFVRWVIAHELAHAHLRNAGRWPGDDPERAADALAQRWGFPKPKKD